MTLQVVYYTLTEKGKLNERNTIEGVKFVQFCLKGFKAFKGEDVFWFDEDKYKIAEVNQDIVVKEE